MLMSKVLYVVMTVSEVVYVCYCKFCCGLPSFDPAVMSAHTDTISTAKDTKELCMLLCVLVKMHNDTFAHVTLVNLHT